jgi:hypothetical protein
MMNSEGRSFKPTRRPTCQWPGAGDRACADAAAVAAGPAHRRPPVAPAHDPTPPPAPSGYKRASTRQRNPLFLLSIFAATRAPPAAAQRRLAVAPTTHFSIPSGQRTSASSRCFCPTACSSSHTPSTPALDHAAVVRHRR